MSAQPPRRRMLSLEEIRALNAQAPPSPPPRQLSPSELEDLRARLNQGEDPQDENEHNAYYQLGIIRYEHDVDDLLARVRSEVLDTSPEATARLYAEGILDAVAWAHGEHHEGPVTNEVEDIPQPSTGALGSEAAAATQMLCGQRQISAGVSTSYLSGVEATLLWLVCAGPDPWT